MDWARAKLQLRRTLATLSYSSGLNSLLSRFHSPSWKILTYHRIINPEDNDFPLQPGMYVRPETFALHMHYLKVKANVISLERLVEHFVSSSPLPERAVVITFDDGWLDNYTYAHPILQKLALPASIFLATGFVGTTELFWTDRVAQGLFALSKESKYREQVLGRLWKNFQPVIEIRSLIDKTISLGHLSLDNLDNIIMAMKARPAEERRRTVDELRTLTKEFTNTKTVRLFADWNEVQEMAEKGIRFGSHSHHHHPMSELTPAQLRDDLSESYQAFHAHGLDALSSFCYPGGYCNDLSQAALREQGITTALLAGRRSDLLAEPRLLGRVHLHEDICSSLPLFTSYVWGPSVFAA